MRFYNNYTIQLGSWTEINNPWGVDLLDKLSLLPFWREFTVQPQKSLGSSAVSNKLTQNTK